MQTISDKLFIKPMTHVFIKDHFPFRAGEVIELRIMKEDFRNEINNPETLRELTQEDKDNYVYKDFTRYGD
jgi:hypothetical protein